MASFSADMGGRNASHHAAVQQAFRDGLDTGPPTSDGYARTGDGNVGELPAIPAASVEEETVKRLCVAERDSSR